MGRGAAAAAAGTHCDVNADGEVGGPEAAAAVYGTLKSL